MKVKKTDDKTKLHNARFMIKEALKELKWNNLGLARELLQIALKESK